MSEEPDDAAAIRSEVTRKAIVDLRKRLLDLSNRNRLLNYRHRDTARQIRLVDTSLDAIFTRLGRGDAVPFNGVPNDDETEPANFEDELAHARLMDEEYIAELARAEVDADASFDAAEAHLRRKVRDTLGLAPDERTRRTAVQVAHSLGIATDVELPQSGRDNATFQTVLFDDALERKLASIREEAISSIQERGVNTLYCALAFLEWFESDDSSKAIQSPLLLVPLELDRSVQNGKYRYAARGSDEDVESNVTLIERLYSDFRLTLPRFNAERPFVDYLREVDLAIASQKRWRLRTFATVGLFDFTRLAMYKDLDPDRRSEAQALEKHEILLDLLGGAVEKSIAGGSQWSEDPHHRDAPVLVTDADSSQFAAIIEGLAGRSFVIEGPPGTGKSQTITNLIAAAIAAGKSVVFVADKLAALQVVKNRLDGAGLGNFCLELHSTKARRSEVYESIKKRLNFDAAPPPSLDDILDDLQHKKGLIEGYCESLHSLVGSLGMSVHELIWREQVLRQTLGAFTHSLEAETIPKAEAITKRQLIDLKTLLSNVIARRRSYDAAHGSIRLHPLAAVRAANLSQNQVAELRDGLQMIMQVLNRLRNLLQQLGLANDREDATVGAYQWIVDTLRSIDSVQPAATADDLAAASALRSTAEAIRLGRCLAELTRRRASWSATLYESASADIRELDRLLELLDANGVDDLSGIERGIGESQERLKKLAAANRSISAVEQMLPGSVPRTRLALDALVSVIAVLGDADPRVLAEQGGRLIRTAPLSTVTAARETAERLSTKLQQLRKTFDLGLIGETNQLRRAAGILREANFISPLFSGEVREANRLYRRIALVKDASDQLARATRFVELADVLDEKVRFEQDDRLNKLFGQAFCGLDTDFEVLEGTAQLAENLREELARHGEAGIAIELQLCELSGLQLGALRGASKSPDFPALHDFCRTVPPTSSLTDHIGKTESICSDLEDMLSLRRSLNIPADVRSDALAQLRSHLASENFLREEFRSNAEASEYFAPQAVADDIERKTAALQCVDVLRSSDVDILREHREPELLIGSHEVQDLFSTWDALMEQVVRIERAAKIDVSALLHGPFLDATLETVAGAARIMSQHLSDLPDWLQHMRATRSVDQKGLSSIVDSSLETGADAEAALEYVLVRTLIRSALEKNQALGDVVGNDLTMARTGFQAADASLLRANQARLRRDLHGRQVDPGRAVGRRGTWTGLKLIMNEAGKNRGHVPLRDLMRRSGTALQQLKPCFMMSPLSVAQFIEPGALKFDLLVIDEASQMRPEDALGSVSRAGQLVVVGDPKQLPPTAFFDRAQADDEVPDEDVVETESILDLAMQQYGRPRRLLWHYRSRHDSLIAFSNKHFYDGELQVFPSPDQSGEMGVRYRYVGGKYRASVNPVEASCVADRALEIMRLEPGKSLGIVAMNQAQRDLIRLEFDRRSLLDASAQRYLEHWQDRLEPFIIKNLESIQGDERDLILISTVYGPDDGGHVFQRFGPINSRNGWRRLNVLYTRAKLRVEVISSLRVADIILDERTGRGVRALRDYLDYIVSGRLEGGVVAGRPPDSDFEIAVSDLLKLHGFECVPQVGVAGFFIDIGVIDPRDPGRFILGVECDGRTYHSTKAARDRDRLKDEVLLRLGWNLHRVWSTDWFADPSREVQRIVAVIKRLCAPDGARSKGNDPGPPSVRPEQEVPRGALRLEMAPTLDLRMEAAKVDEVLLESDILAAIRSILPPGTELEREKLLRSISASLKQPLNRRLRSAVNTMISAEVRSGRLQVDTSWSIVRRP